MLTKYKILNIFNVPGHIFNLIGGNVMKKCEIFVIYKDGFLQKERYVLHIFCFYNVSKMHRTTKWLNIFVCNKEINSTGSHLT